MVLYLLLCLVDASERLVLFLGEKGMGNGSGREGNYGRNLKESFGCDVLYERINKHLKKDGGKVSV